MRRSQPSPFALALALAQWRRAPALVPIVVGLVVLAIGVLVYLVDRQPSRMLLRPAAQGLSDLQLFGAAGSWLPSFAHTCAFSLFTAAVLGPGAALGHRACAAWCLTNLAFEFGQHPQLKVYWADALLGGWAGTPWLRPLAQYFLHGCFDAADVVAAVAGAAAAAAVLHFLQTTVEVDHAP